MKRSILLLSCALSFMAWTANAQTTIWGVGTGNPTQEQLGQFDTQNNTLASIGWNTAGSGPFGPCEFQWLPDGVLSGFYSSADVPIQSPSISNGCATFDSDFWGYGTNGNNGSAGQPQSVTMTSPAIDLTGYMDSAISIKFYTSWRVFSVSTKRVGFSVDGGTNYSWTDILPLANFTTWDGFIEAPISAGALAGVTNLTDCRIAFEFGGDSYSWSIDDLSIITRSPYDLTFDVFGSTTNFGVAQPTSYRQIPLNQATELEYMMAAMVTNLGGSTISTSLNPQVHYELQYDSGSGWTTLLEDSTAITSDILENDTAFVLENVTSTFAPLHNTAGDYRMLYRLTHDASDGDRSNDTLIRAYQVTDQVYSHSPLNISGYPQADNATIAGVSPGSVLQEFEWGNLYSIANDGFIDSIRYSMFVPSNLAPSIAALPLEVNVYQWVDLDNNAVYDFSTEFQLVASYPDTIPITANDIGTFMNLSINTPDTASNGTSLEVSGGEVYWVAINQVNPQGIFDIDAYGFFAANTTTDLLWNQSQDILAFTPMRVAEGPVGGTTTESWFNGFSGTSTTTPAIQLHLGNCEDPQTTFSASSTELDANFTQATTNTGATSYVWDFGDGNSSTDENPTHTYATGGVYNVCLTVTDFCGTDTYCEDITIVATGIEEELFLDFEVYPNPNNGQFAVALATNGNNAYLEVFNSLGGLVYSQSLMDGNNNIETKGLAAGAYTVVVTTDESRAVQQLMIR